MQPEVSSTQKPWGGFVQYTHNQRSTVKILTVKAGQQLSLQSHEKREELWIMLDSGITVEIDRKSSSPGIGESVFIPRKSLHRASAKVDGRILEISFGDFDENDIKRHSDIYGRA